MKSRQNSTGRKKVMSILRMENLTFAYAGTNQLVLEDININVAQGEYALVIGKSGSGKTTLLKMMKKSMMPVGRMTGHVLFCGCDIQDMESRENAALIGLVGQSPDHQIVTDTVWHELAFGLENLGLDNEKIRKRVAEFAEYFGITQWYNKKVDTLSGGQKQILNLASVMVMQPRLLLFDEPTAGLDPLAASAFFDTVRRINKELGVTIIMAEHNLESVYGDADLVFVLEEGKVLCHGSPRQTAQYLIREENPLKRSLPSAARIYKILRDGSGDNIPIPLSVREGRLWLHKKFPGAEAPVKCGAKEEELSKGNTDYACVMKNVTFSYDKSGSAVLDKLNLSIERGKITAIVGGNGSGKSTIFKLLAGIEKKYRGSVTVKGRVVLLPQNPLAVFTEISAEEEIAEVLMDKHLDDYKGLSISQKKEIVQQSLNQFGLEKFRKSNPYDLSGGQQEKLAIAKALLLKPDILLLDEPTNGLDSFFKEVLGRQLRDLSESGMTIVIVSHDVEFAASYSDRCAFLFDRNIVSFGSTKSFFAGNMFYTTNVNKIVSDLFEDVVTIDDVRKYMVENGDNLK